MPYKDKTKRQEANRASMAKSRGTHQGYTEDRGTQGVRTPCCEEHRHLMEARLERQRTGSCKLPCCARGFTPNVELLGITKPEAVKRIAKMLDKPTKDLNGDKTTYGAMVFCGDVRLDELT